MTQEILETRAGTKHTHINECGRFTVTKLVADVTYQLVKCKYFTDWYVTGYDAEGERHCFECGSSGLSGESCFMGIFS